MTKFVSYLRVSSQRQGSSGLGLEAQRAAVSQYIHGVGGTLLEEHLEIESGSVRNRPILSQALARAKNERAILVIAKLDRLARNVAFVSALLEAGVEFVAVDCPMANRLMVHILAAFAEHERLLISERTKAALASAKLRGVRLGVNGQRLANQHRMEAQAHAENLRPAILSAQNGGADTLIKIADILNESGLHTREGCPWGPAAVQRVMRRLELSTPAMVS